MRVDILNDFMPWGALPVPFGDEVVGPANELTGDPSYSLVVDIQDWHPPDHGSFASTYPDKKVHEEIELRGLPQRLWPAHCVRGTPGADFHPDLVRTKKGRPIPVIRKGIDPSVDSYSGFFDNGRMFETPLRRLLQQHGIDEVDVIGLATDYCVAATALDAISLGYRTRVLLEGCRGVGISENDIADALRRIREAGGETIPPSRPLCAPKGTLVELGGKGVEGR